MTFPAPEPVANEFLLPCKPDVVFPGQRVVVFCDGDFWYGKDWAARKRKPKKAANPAYSVKKIESNMAGDRRHEQELVEQGWWVLRYWESDINADSVGVARVVARALRQRA